MCYETANGYVRQTHQRLTEEVVTDCCRQQPSVARWHGGEREKNTSVSVKSSLFLVITVVKSADVKTGSW